MDSSDTRVHRSNYFPVAVCPGRAMYGCCWRRMQSVGSRQRNRHKGSNPPSIQERPSDHGEVEWGALSLCALQVFVPRTVVLKQEQCIEKTCSTAVAVEALTVALCRQWGVFRAIGALRFSRFAAEVTQLSSNSWRWCYVVARCCHERE
eukprot:2287200-Amphidinium_carterae.1